jgi:hypothetical protein
MLNIVVVVATVMLRLILIVVLLCYEVLKLRNFPLLFTEAGRNTGVLKSEE